VLLSSCLYIYNSSQVAEYNDIVILPIRENMNSGKTHAFFSWASAEARVPPPYVEAEVPTPIYSYSNTSSPAPPLAAHDPLLAHQDNTQRPWVRPDFILKSDDDSFVMLAELEARLRVELHSTEQNGTEYWNHAVNQAGLVADDLLAASTTALSSRADKKDPQIYWGYLIKNRFMGGEIYGLSWALANWVAQDAEVSGMTSGAEDKQTAKWMNAYPRRAEVRWASERCWIYNHPRSNTVYAPCALIGF
jgi:hypothetical protein